MPENSYLRTDRKISAGAETRFSAFLDSIASYARSGSWIVIGKFGLFRRLPDIRSTYGQTFSIAFEFTNVPAHNHEGAARDLGESSRFVEGTSSRTDSGAEED